MKGLGSNDPRQLGRNRIVAVIGQGGMGRVLLGQSVSGRLVAVKQVHRHLSKNAEFRERFRREVAASRQVTGAYTAAVVDSDTESATPWLATEYIPGPSLKTVIEATGPMSLGGLRLLAAGLASALIEIHRAGLVHRDLKPANVLLAADGPRVIDFGIARAMEGDAELTATGSVVGSPAYMSPEQAQGQPLTPAADVFSVGAILVMAATGAGPFVGTATPQVLYNVIHTPPETSRVPEPLRAIVERCLSKDPGQRPTPEQLLEAAGSIAAEPVWSGAVQDAISEHRSDSDWWVETTAKHARYESQLADLKDRRRRTVRFVGAALGVLLLFTATAYAGHRWAEQPGQAAPASDLAVTLTGEQWRTIDPCALLEGSLHDEFGARTGDSSTNSAGQCSAEFTDSAGTERTFDVAIGVGIATSRNRMRPTGTVAGWMPIYGLFDQGASCDRWVISQGRPSVAVRFTARESGSGADGCPAAERGIQAVVTRLAVNPPRLALPAGTIRTLDPCDLVDRPKVTELTGNSVRQRSAPTNCYWSGDDYYVSLELTEGARPDRAGGSRSTEPRQLDGETVYVDDIQAAHGTAKCELTYLARPTRDDRAEIVKITIGSWHSAPDTCDRAARLFSTVLPRLTT
ncbi:serine/threonine-protein kinase [Nocardia otitidiscaviarum]|uniref:serine/threonine-protein kinase n=1 Tax=Nocardia otitidiscaviarum TaxID=1823 RepID=UPI001892E567|nr:serine/threonine-protein kinase [Nocardia otitidiscaviarum]MBF6179643.1 serine/threonine protein kinase [Nocardia otitidiscaviarum]